MRYLASLALFALFLAAEADDGFLNSSGAPRLLSKHPTIRMARERVVVTIHPDGYHVDATFEFRNEGRTCTVRMGFPDDGEDESDPGPGQPHPPQESLAHFRSWVDGRAVKTALVRNVSDASTWHVKHVPFRAGQTRRVRVSYDADGGGATNSGGHTIRQASYTMHTGASWRGPIGLAELVVRFEPGTLVGRPVLVAIAALKDPNPYEFSGWEGLSRSTVFWEGFAPPTLRGREMRFVRRGFEPGENDDVSLFFGLGHRFK